VKKVESGGGGLSLFKRDENGKASDKGGSGTKVFVEIRQKSTGEEMRVNGNGVKNDDDEVESFIDELLDDWQGQKDGGERVSQVDARMSMEEDMEGMEKLRRGLRSTSARKKYN
jgi:hypothetical protein